MTIDLNSLSVHEEEEFPVVVYVYDLSNGLAAEYLYLILGTYIPSIYHTSVVVYDKEHYIDQGIQICNNPGSTKYGKPIEYIDMGYTSVDPETFEHFICNLCDHELEKYHASNYDLFENNCNHFSNTVVEFLVGRGLDQKIMSIPATVTASPNGLFLRHLLSKSVTR